MRAGGLALGTVTVGVLTQAAAVGAAPPKEIAPLPSAAAPITSSPPLRTAAALFELRLPGRVHTRQRVDVGIDAAGAPASIVATQRLTLVGKGDYAFLVQAPALDVVPAAGTESEPGLRQGAILWNGFNPHRRVLASRATLRVGPAAPSLPLRLRVDARVAGAPLDAGTRRSGRLELSLTIENRTTARATALDGLSVPVELARVLDRLRATTRSGGIYLGELVHVARGPRGLLESRRVLTEAPLRVRGTIRFPSGTATGLVASNARVARGGAAFSMLLGDGQPLRAVVRLQGEVRGVGVPVISIEAVPVFPRGLEPPGDGSWRDALDRGLVRRDGRALLRRATDVILRLSRVRQYAGFLANPDALPRAGSDQTVYVFRTAPRAKAAPPAVPSGGGGGVLLPVMLSVGGALGAAALVVFWAHS